MVLRTTHLLMQLFWKVGYSLTSHDLLIFLSPESCSVELMHFLAFVSLGFILFAHIRSFLWRLFWFLVLYLGCGWIWFTSTRQVISLEDRSCNSQVKWPAIYRMWHLNQLYRMIQYLILWYFLAIIYRTVSGLHMLLYGLHIHHRFVEI